ncbi:MAG TPA: helix-turn-helix transcriptional regulator [Fibrobacteria bacterium]|nr:helix-turn-helix transcriptional regulator [Fibrobacteria bacterium]
MGNSGRLKKFRESLGLDYAGMAGGLGLEYQAYYQYENGKRKIPQEILNALALKGLNLNWLATGEGSMRREPTFQELLYAEDRPAAIVGQRVPTADADTAAGRGQVIIDGQALEVATALVDELCNERVVPAKTRWDLISLVAQEYADLRALGRPEEIRDRFQKWVAVARIGLDE